MVTRGAIDVPKKLIPILMLGINIATAMGEYVQTSCLIYKTISSQKDFLWLTNNKKKVPPQRFFGF